MVTRTLHCPHCQSEVLVRNGHAPNGKQLYRCRACGRQSRENPTPHAYPHARRQEMLHAYQERSSLRGLTRTFGVSRTTVSSWIKKKELSFLPHELPCSPRIPKIPLPRSWNWMSSGRLSSKKRTTPGCGLPCAARRGKWSPMRLGIGAKRHASGCGRLFPRSIARAIARRDFLRVYASVIPEEQHTAVGKETGETAHVERWNNTLRQRLARFVRMTLSFSKSEIMHEACLLLFLHRYNLDRAILLK